MPRARDLRLVFFDRIKPFGWLQQNRAPAAAVRKHVILVGRSPLRQSREAGVIRRGAFRLTPKSVGSKQSCERGPLRPGRRESIACYRRRRPGARQQQDSRSKCRKQERAVRRLGAACGVCACTLDPARSHVPAPSADALWLPRRHTAHWEEIPPTVPGRRRTLPPLLLGPSTNECFGSPAAG